MELTLKTREDSIVGYLLRRIPPALGNARIFLHCLVFDQLLTLTLQLLNLMGEAMQEKTKKKSLNQNSLLYFH